ncbi:MAG: hypothetical protein ACM359_13205 [Bacillota bacterium]
MSEPAEEAVSQDGTGIPPEIPEEGDVAVAAETRRPNNNLVMLLAALMIFGGGGLMFMRMKAGPATAAANTEAVTAKATINEFLTDGGKNLNAMRELLKNTEKLVQVFLSYPSTNQVRLEDLKTNPFRFSREKADDPNAAAQAELKRKQAEKEAIVKAAQQLQIQSTLVSGKVHTCMINNKMYTEGQQVDSFTIEKVTPEGIVVKRNDYRFELRMKR